MYYGIGVSPGIAMGIVRVVKDQEMVIEKVITDDVTCELSKFSMALEKSKNEIIELYKTTLENVGENEAKIFEAHQMIVDDIEIKNQVELQIKMDKVNAAWALKQVSDKYISLFSDIEDAYLKERASDIKDVSSRILRHILNAKENQFEDLDESMILVSNDFTPSDTAKMSKGNVVAFISEIGGKTSHSAIMARSMEIPAVVGLEKILESVKDNDYVILDGSDGTVIVNPATDIIKQYELKRDHYMNYRNNLNSYIGISSKTKNHIELEIAANIGSVDDLSGVIKNDADGIGLFRTEFMYMDRNELPTEDQQFKIYKTVAEKMLGKPVVIRTLDIGGDKEVKYMNLPVEMNPFLGYRAIRLCLDKQDIFITQLKALLRASIYGNIKIMFPMISCVEELRSAKKILEEVKIMLDDKGIPFNKNIEIGMMIEIPSAAIISDIFAKEVDFFSIGTNDLIQYTVAVDRGNRSLSKLYTPFHPGVLRLIKQVIDNGHREGIWVGMCGEVAANTLLLPVLATMGLDEFSMSASSVLESRMILSQVDTTKFLSITEEILNMDSAENIELHLKNNNPRLLDHNS